MPGKGVGWSSMGQVFQHVNEQSTTTIDEAPKILVFGAPSDDRFSGKPCPYQTLPTFCTSVVAYVEHSAGTLGRGRPPSRTRDWNLLISEPNSVDTRYPIQLARLIWVATLQLIQARNLMSDVEPSSPLRSLRSSQPQAQLLTSMRQSGKESVLYRVDEMGFSD